MKLSLLFVFVTSLISTQSAHPGVVRILGKAGDQVVRRSLGFIVEKEGFLLTNYRHLTNEDSGRLLENFEVQVDQKTYPAAVIGVEPTLNLGILKIESDAVFTPTTPALKRVVEAGVSIKAVALDAAGQSSEIEGVVTALNTKKCYQESLTATMFRAKVTIPDESVGGPIFFADSGEVAAIYTGYKPVAEPGHEENADEVHLLPIDLCFNIYESIKTKQSLKSPWTGFSVRPLNAKEQHFFPTAKKHHGGIAIEHVWKDSLAEKLGIQVGDVLVQFAYNRILNVGDFQKWLYMYGVGQPVKLIILRQGTEYVMLDYVIEERPQWAKPK